MEKPRRGFEDVLLITSSKSQDGFHPALDKNQVVYCLLTLLLLFSTTEQQCWTGVRLSTATGEQQYIKASAKYYAVALQGGGGPLCVGRLDRPGRFEPGTSPIVQGHTGAVLDVDFNPFDDSMFASASEDTTIKIWSIPEEWEPTDDKGNAKEGTDLTESLVDLAGHQKKVTLLRFHPSANNILLSTGADSTVKVWDIEAATAVHTFGDFADLAQDIVWDVRGDNYAVTCKDKMVRFLDGRTGVLSSSIEVAHEGPKSVKLCYLGETGKILTCGSSKQSSREVKIWDVKNLKAPTHTETIDTASGALIPLFDSDTNVLYLCGKGDGIVRLYEFEDKDPFFYKLNDGFRSTLPSKGCCMVPKRGLDVMQHETARILKVTSSQGVHPLVFTVPRKSDSFQDDIFPDTSAPTPAHSAEEWLGGSSKPPVTMSLNPAVKTTTCANGVNGHKKVALKTVGQLNAELEEALKRIKYLESVLTKNNIPFDGGDEKAVDPAE